MAVFKGLRDFREHAGISQNELSRKSGVSRDTISSAERGNSHTPDKLHALRNTLNDLYYDGTNGRKNIPPTVVVGNS